MPTLSLRLAVRMHRARLDEQLADGRRPDSDPALALRAAELASPGARRRLAAALLRLIDVAGRTPPRNAAAPVDRPAVLEARALLLQLAERLQREESVNPRGVAMVSRLITDGTGPVYEPGHPLRLERPRRPLWDELRAALVGLDRLRPLS